MWFVSLISVEFLAKIFSYSDGSCVIVAQPEWREYSTILSTKILIPVQIRK